MAKAKKSSKSSHKDPLSRHRDAKLAAETAREDLLSILDAAQFRLAGGGSSTKPPRHLQGALEILLYEVECKLSAIAGTGAGWYHNPAETPSIGALVLHGFVEFMMRVGVEFLRWDTLYAESETPLVNRAWVIAVEMTGTFASIIFANTSEPSYASFASRWNASSPPLLHALSKLKIWDEMQYFSLLTMNETISFMSSSAELAAPMIDFAKWGIPRPSQQVCEDAIRVAFQVRHAIVGCRNNQDAIVCAAGTTMRLNDAVPLLVKILKASSSPFEGRDFSSITGLSYEAVLRSLITVQLSEEMQMELPMGLRGFGHDLRKIYMLRDILKLDPSRALIEAIADEKIISWAAKAMRDVIAAIKEDGAGGLGGRNGDRTGMSMINSMIAHQPAMRTDTMSTFVTIFAEILEPAAKYDIHGPALEMCKGNVIFGVEAFSQNTAFDPPDLLSQLTRAWFDGFDRMRQMALYEVAIKQMMTATARLLSRSDSNAETRKNWKTAYLSGFVDPQSPEPQQWADAALAKEREKELPYLKVCATIGCTSVVLPSMQCTACRLRAYCGQECQFKDWKSHKSECKAAKKKAKKE